jgi:hypothetical protein
MDALTAIRNRFIRRRVSESSVVRQWRSATCSGIAVVLGACAMLGCSSDTAGTTLLAPSQLFYTLRMNYHAVNLALVSPYDTVRLVAIPRAADGSVLAGADVQYRAADSTVTVSSDGLVQARYQTSRTTIVATLTMGGLTLKDTTVLHVTASPFDSPLATLSAEPMTFNGDIQAIGRLDDDTYGTNTMLYYIAKLTSGTTVCADGGCFPPLLVALSSADPSIASVGQDGTIHPYTVGHVTLYVSTFAYGVALTDSLPFVVGYQGRLLANVIPDSSTTPFGITETIGYSQPPLFSVGGKVGITNRTADSVEISVSPSTTGVIFGFDDTKTKDTLAADKFRFVFFDSAGTYTLHYRSLLTGDVDSQTVIAKPFP